MASISTDSTGNRRIQFVAGDGVRKAIRIGNCSKRDAESFKIRVEALHSAKLLGNAIDRDTSLWLNALADDLHARLAAVGLVASRHKIDSPTVAEFVDGYLSERADLKASTLLVMQQARIWLVRHLGEGKLLRDVTVADADAYRAAMIRTGLAKATIAKRSKYARHYFAVAKRRGLIAENSFEHLKGATKGDPSRRLFIPAESVATVVDHVVDPQWKLLIALGRWGGLRVPSEALSLKWTDVDVERKRFIVRAAKTEHHDDGGVRVVPMFPELVEHFRQVFDDADVGAVFVISRYRNSAQNLRTQFQRFIEQAGVTPWPKPWQNLRVSRATELADLFPSHVSAAWLGHSEKIADAFYRQVTDSHFDRATRIATSSKAAQNPAQLASETLRKGSQVIQPANEQTPVLQGFARACEGMQLKGLGPQGLEP